MLITATEARLYHPELGGTGEDTHLETLIGDVDQILAEHLGWPPATAAATPTLESTTYTRYYGARSVHGSVLRLGLRPVTDVTSVYVDPDWSWDAGDLVDSSDYSVVGDRGELHLTPSAQQGWSRADRANKVTFAAGWETAPPALKRLVARAVKYLWQTRHVEHDGAAPDPNRPLLPAELLDLAERWRLPASYAGSVGSL